MRIFLLTIMLLCLVHSASAAQLVYSGEQTLWQDTIWEGDVLIDGILTVAPGVTLEIRPGSIIRFTRMDSNRDDIGEHELFIQGRFLALGTKASPILFTSAEPEPVPGDWGAVNMMASTEENVLEHCQVEYGYRGFHAHFAMARLGNSLFRYNRRGAQFQESTVDIRHCAFIDNLNGIQFRDSTVTLHDSVISGGYWGLRCVYSTIEMANCRIEKNLINGANFRDSEVTLKGNTVIDNRRGIYLQRSQGSITGNIVERNSEHGIFLEDSTGRIALNRIADNGRAGFRIINSPANITGNRIVDNDQYALINDGEQDLSIEGNWWGTSEPAQIAVLVRDGVDRPGIGFVRINQPLTAAPSE